MHIVQCSWLVNLILADKNDQLVSPPTIFVSNLLPREICLPIDHTVWLQRLVNTSCSLQYQGCCWIFSHNFWVLRSATLLIHVRSSCPQQSTFCVGFRENPKSITDWGTEPVIIVSLVVLVLLVLFVLLVVLLFLCVRLALDYDYLCSKMDF